MRWAILRPLLHKELQRHLANRAGLELILLLVAASLLLSLFRSAGPEGGLLGVRLCYIDYAGHEALVEHLQRHVPAELAGAVQFRPLTSVPVGSDGRLLYPSNAGAIQLRSPSQADSAGIVWIWHPGADRSAMAPYEAWFWKETLRFEANQQRQRYFESDHASLHKGMDSRTGLATSLILFGLFFVCVYLLPSMTCEERERGILLAQALSPASTAELLGARVLFYAGVGLLLAALLAVVHEPAVFLRPFFWLALLVCAMGAVGVGVSIACLARTQRAASFGAMAYLLAVSLLLLICQHNNIHFLPHLALEYHGPRMLHAALIGEVAWYHWVSLLVCTILAGIWLLLANALFRRCGWQ